MSERLSWIAGVVALLLVFVLPIVVARAMKRHGWEAWSAIWFAAGSTAAGLSIGCTVAMDGRTSHDSFEAKLFFMFLWWLYLGFATEMILNYWRKQ